jgi:uncharacterized protein
MNAPRGVSGALNLHFTRIADFCIRHAWMIIVATVLLGAGAADYVARHFALNTDTRNLLSSNLPWRKRDLPLHQRGPRFTTITAIINRNDQSQHADEL